MRYQPLFLEVLGQDTATTLETCGEKHLTILEAGTIPTFYLPISDLGEYAGSNIGVILVDLDGNETILGQIFEPDFVGAVSTNGEFIISKKYSGFTFGEGIFRIKLKVATGDGDFLISDTYKFVENPDECYTRIEYWNDCSYYVPYERSPDNKYEFWLNKSAFAPDELTNEEEFEELLDKTELSVEKVFERFEVLRMFNLSTRTYESIVEGLSMNYFNVIDPDGSTITSDNIIEKQIDAPEYNNEGCCIFRVDLRFKRERFINDECCDGKLTDCVDYDLVKVKQIENHLNFTTAGVNLAALGIFGCYLSDLFDVVYCTDSVGLAFSRQPEHVYDMNTGQWYFYDEDAANPFSGGTGQYVEFMNILSITQTAQYNVDVELQTFKYQCFKIWYRWNGGTWLLDVESSSGGVEQDTSFTVPVTITPRGDEFTGNNLVEIKVEYCNEGCTPFEVIDTITIFVP